MKKLALISSVILVVSAGALVMRVNENSKVDSTPINEIEAEERNIFFLAEKPEIEEIPTVTPELDEKVPNVIDEVPEVPEKTTEKEIPQPAPEEERIEPVADTSICNEENLLLVNKTHKYDQNLDTGGIKSTTSKCLDLLLADASSSGLNMYVLSGYRSYQEQEKTFNYWISVYGEEEARRVSAEPGYSEHQTGLAIDLGSGVCDTEECFGQTSEGKWLATNAYKYGFIIRYPQNKEDITGYSYEPWHLRYVGINAATAIKDSGATLEEYLGVFD